MKRNVFFHFAICILAKFRSQILGKIGQLAKFCSCLYPTHLHEGVQGYGRLPIVPESAGAVGDGLPVALQLPLQVLVGVVDLGTKLVHIW